MKDAGRPAGDPEEECAPTSVRFGFGLGNPQSAVSQLAGTTTPDLAKGCAPDDDADDDHDALPIRWPNKNKKKKLRKTEIFLWVFLIPLQRAFSLVLRFVMQISN